MSDDTNSQSFRVSYGHGQTIAFTIPRDRVAWQHFASDGIENVAEAIENALEGPIDFPALSQTVIPDDQVVIAADADTPGLSLILRAACSALTKHGLPPGNITILQAEGANDPRSDLPDDLRNAVNCVTHDSGDKDALAYLANTTDGERIELARVLTDADVAVSVGRIGFDAVLGYRGTNSAFYPLLSSKDAIEKARGQGHSELEPEDSRPLRQIVDEVGWLLGTQFTIQTLPARNDGVASVLAGSTEPVLRRGKEYLDTECMVTPDERVDLAVVAITNDAGGHGWDQLGAAIATARRVVAKDGKILVLSEINEPLDRGLQILKLVEAPSEAIKPMRLDPPSDVVPATQITNAVQWANVYLLSNLEENLVDDLFMFPLRELSEAVRLIESSEGRLVIIEDAHNVHGRIAE